MAEIGKEYWVYIEQGSTAEWGLLAHCATLLGAEECLCALMPETLRPEMAFRYGAKKAYQLCGSAEAQQRGIQIARASRENAPVAILFTADVSGRMTAATVAALLEAGLAADCTQLARQEEGLFVMTRPTFGASLMADILCPTVRPQMATIRPGVYLPPACVLIAAEGAVIKLAPPEEAPKLQLLSRRVLEKQDLTMAKILVVGGKGVGSQEGFALLRRLAETLGAAVGASRGAVNAGYADYHQQIGLTGQAVQPEVYLAFGVSGAVQHLAGMEKSKQIIAINTDPHAPIFEYADYALICDWEQAALALLDIFTADTPNRDDAQTPAR